MNRLEKEFNISYQHFLVAEFESRKLRNPSYSLRAYARDLGIAAPKLSEVLRGKCGLSEGKADSIASHLKLAENEKRLFINLVSAKHARSRIAKDKARDELIKSQALASYDKLSLETFKIIADWYNFALLELTEVADFQSNPKWIAKRLNISAEAVKESIERFIDFGLLEKKNGRLVQTHKSLATPSGIPSAEIKKHHRQILSKAEESLTLDPVHVRDFSAMTLAIPQSAFAEVQAEIKKFRREISAKYLKSEKKERVYSLAIQFFPLDQKDEGTV